MEIIKIVRSETARFVEAFYYAFRSNVANNPMLRGNTFGNITNSIRASLVACLNLSRLFAKFFLNQPDAH